MEQKGYIVEIVDDITAKLKMQRHSACASCGQCATSSEKKDIIVEVDNTIGAKVGDQVIVNMETVNVLKAAAIVYILPLVGLIGGTMLMHYALEVIGIVNNIEIISGVFGLVLMAMSFVLLKMNDKKFRESREYIPIVTKIVG